MHFTRREALLAGSAALTSLLPAMLPLHGATAQDESPSRQLTQAYNASGQHLFEAFSAAPGNIVFSPYSIGTAMAMALAGARGETEREMIAVLKHRLTRAEINAANASVLATLNGYDRSAVPPTCPAGMSLDHKRCEAPPAVGGECRLPARRESELCVAEPNFPPSAKLSVADALMLTGQGHLISGQYAALLRDKYAAEIFEGAGLDQINSWVSRKTEGKIDKILDQLDPSAAAVLLNAVYFKAKWASVFGKSATRNEAFNLTAAEQVPVPMMRKAGTYALVARQGYRAIRLPYDVNALGMIIVLPDTIDGIAEAGARLGTDEPAQLFAALRAPDARTPVDLALPRFKVTFKAGLGSLFQLAGMQLAFDPRRADFSGMTGRPPSEARLAIGAIVHRAVVDVMEDGTEAAAATAVAMLASSAPARDPQAFRVDRPFLFYIVDDATGAILFQGRVSDPR